MHVPFGHILTSLNIKVFIFVNTTAWRGSQVCPPQCIIFVSIACLTSAAFKYGTESERINYHTLLIVVLSGMWEFQILTLQLKSIAKMK